MFTNLVIFCLIFFLFFLLRTPIRNSVRKALPHLLLDSRSEPNIVLLLLPLFIPCLHPFLSEIRRRLKDPIYTTCCVNRVGRKKCDAFRESVAEFPGTKR